MSCMAPVMISMMLPMEAALALLLIFTDNPEPMPMNTELMAKQSEKTNGE